MTLIPELERELERVMPVRRARRSLHVGLGFSAALLVGTTAALAATGVLQVPVGEPTKDQLRLTPNEGIGALTPGTVRVLAVQAEDPDGGPPWGLRVAMTTRKLGCLQAGRLVDGRIGVLGRDGAFDDDGKFHPIPDGTIGHAATCLQLDAKGQLIGSVAYGGLPASASSMGECAAPQFTRGVPKDELCAPESIRILYYGLLGPAAKSIVVDGTREIPTSGEEGAYLIVDRIGDSGLGGVGTSPVPVNTPITEIRFKDGSSCAVTVTGPDASCVNPGYTAPQAPAVDVTAPIRVRTSKNGKQRWRARISFRAPVAITDASTAYAIMLSVPSKKHKGRRIGTLTQKNIKAGETVTFEFDSLGGHGRYHGEVTYQRHSGGVVQGPRRDGRRVGKVSFRLP